MKGYQTEKYNIRPQVIATYKKYRLDVVSPDTVKRESGMISRILTSAEKNFGNYLPHENPVSKVKKPIATARDRRPTDKELEPLVVPRQPGWTE